MGGNKLVVLGVVLLIAFVSGCSSDTLPPTPSDPGVSKTSTGGLVGHAFEAPLVEMVKFLV